MVENELTALFSITYFFSVEFLNAMRKVLVIGSGGAGKSVFASRLGALLKIEVLHLDRFYWRSGWSEPPKDQWQKTVDELLRRDAWIMDGNYSGTLARRVDACDTVIFLDLPRVLCIWRVLKRALIYRNDIRPDMAEGCPRKTQLRVHRLGVELLDQIAAQDSGSSKVKLREKEYCLAEISF
jgi:adenylate kinase family enzyme